MGRSGQTARRVDRAQPAQQEPELRQLLDRAEAIARVSADPVSDIEATQDRGRRCDTSACAKGGPAKRGIAS